ncbi:hypothetical protein A2108_01310 [Candidatus Wolfebacteria bacterium GWA1_42_9]|uniref:Endonuclease NucS C-terminal domain-containing protein n=1 Tax=Candidatus Wolfebacteria bacterium GWA1_42_9 TaxID=1802553 RepID=A0A1F8DMS1_9BACT|nr:MAG: hypothetical protein A2108_01310 [Candidatus Wolfebacteria bacterium GWA1_42_9]
MISQQRIKEWIDLYLKYIEDITPEAHVRDEEGYKFKSVDTFQQCFNADASNLAENLDEAIERNNLVAGSMYFPKRVLTILASEYEEEIRDILKNLFNTEKDVSQRVNETENDFNCLVDKRNKEQDEKWEHSFIGLRFLSLLLGFRYPNKYNAIKPREWNMFCKFIDEDFRIPQGTSSGERYKILEPYIDALRAEIRQISEIQKLKEQLTRGLNFVDEEFRWMAQDVIYVTACILASQRGAEKSEQKSTLVSEKPIGVSEDIETEGAMEFPLEEYLENFIVRNWNNIDFGEPLTLYIDDEGSPAQQYPTSEGFIDLLAKDTDDNFVVIELKKGRSNQQVVGQILSYVGWVKNNLAEKDQKVRGIIVTADGNQALLDAVSTVSDFISVKYYCMKFNFTNPE